MTIQDNHSQELDQFHYHEALDRCSLIAEIFETQLIKHSVINSLDAQHPIKQSAEQIGLLLGDLYQNLGKLGIDKD